MKPGTFDGQLAGLCDLPALGAAAACVEEGWALGGSCGPKSETSPACRHLVDFLYSMCVSIYVQRATVQSAFFGVGVPSANELG